MALSDIVLALNICEHPTLTQVISVHFTNKEFFLIITKKMPHFSWRLFHQILVSLKTTHSLYLLYATIIFFQQMFIEHFLYGRHSVRQAKKKLYF